MVMDVSGDHRSGLKRRIWAEATDMGQSWDFGGGHGPKSKLGTWVEVRDLDGSHGSGLKSGT